VSKTTLADAHLNGTCQRASDGRHCHCSLEYGHASTGREYTCCVTGCGYRTVTPAPLDEHPEVISVLDPEDSDGIAPPIMEAAPVTCARLLTAGQYQAWDLATEAYGTLVVRTDGGYQWAWRA
jgi:hypothetical protein